jgi:SHS family lactate transporter-like MFS transporter
MFVAGGENMRATVQGQDVPDYAKVQGIFLGVVAAYLIAVTIFGPECVHIGLLLLRYLTYLRRHHGSEFEKHKTAFEEGGGDDNAYVQEEVLPSARRNQHDIEESPREKTRDSDSYEESPKPEVTTVEKV